MAQRTKDTGPTIGCALCGLVICGIVGVLLGMLGEAFGRGMAWGNAGPRTDPPLLWTVLERGWAYILAGALLGLVAGGLVGRLIGARRKSKPTGQENVDPGAAQ